MWLLRQNINSHQPLKPNSPLFHTPFPVLLGQPEPQKPLFSLPPPFLLCSQSSKLQVVASFSGGGAWTPVSLAQDSLTVQEGRVKSTRRRKSAALDRRAGGTGRLLARARDLEAWSHELEGTWKRGTEGLTSPGGGGCLPLQGGRAARLGAPRSRRVSKRAKDGDSRRCTPLPFSLRFLSVQS